MQMSGRYSGGGSAAPGQAAQFTLGAALAAIWHFAGSARLIRSFCQRRGGSRDAAGAPAPAGSDGEALPATAFALDVRVFEAERLVQALFHEVHHRPIDQREARGVHEHPYAPILEDRISRLRAVGVVDDVRKAGAAGLAYPEAQPRAVPACRQEGLDPIRGRFSE